MLLPVTVSYLITMKETSLRMSPRLRTAAWRQGKRLHPWEWYRATDRSATCLAIALSPDFRDMAQLTILTISARLRRDLLDLQGRASLTDTHFSTFALKPTAFYECQPGPFCLFQRGHSTRAKEAQRQFAPVRCGG